VLPSIEREGFNAEGESFGLKSVGILQGLGASTGEKRVGRDSLEAGPGEQAILSGLLGFNSRAFADVQRSGSQFGQFGADHQEAMTLQRVFLCAHHRHRPTLQFLPEAAYPCLECVGFPARLIIDETIGAIGVRIIRAAS